MKVVGFSGCSGAGKTTLIERLIPLLKARGLRVSVVKHAHRGFDIDRPGKDTFRQRAAGAFEVVIASPRRLALMREFEQEHALTAHQLIAELWDGVDWVLVEGFKANDLPRIEVWRAPVGQAPHYPDDDFIVAIATDDAAQLPVATQRPVLDLDDPASVAQWLLAQGDRLDYQPERIPVWD